MAMSKKTDYYLILFIAILGIAPVFFPLKYTFIVEIVIYSLFLIVVSIFFVTFLNSFFVLGYGKKERVINFLLLVVTLALFPILLTITTHINLNLHWRSNKTEYNRIATNIIQNPNTVNLNEEMDKVRAFDIEVNEQGIVFFLSEHLATDGYYEGIVYAPYETKKITTSYGKIKQVKKLDENWYKFSIY